MGVLQIPHGFHLPEIDPWNLASNWLGFVACKKGGARRVVSNARFWLSNGLRSEPPIGNGVSCMSVHNCALDTITACSTLFPVTIAYAQAHASAARVAPRTGARSGAVRCTTFDHAPKVSWLPVVHSTRACGISILAKSMKSCPLQCMGNTCSTSSALRPAMTLAK